MMIPAEHLHNMTSEIDMLRLENSRVQNIMIQLDYWLKSSESAIAPVEFSTTAINTIRYLMLEALGKV